MSAIIKEDISSVVGGEADTENFFHAHPTRLTNDSRGNLMISIRSEIMEKFFLSICSDKEAIEKGKIKETCKFLSQAVNGSGDLIYIMSTREPLKGVTGTFQDGLLLSDRVTPNMSIITAIGLGQGVDFIFKGMYTAKQVNDALHIMYIKVCEIYKDYAKPLSIEFDIHIKQKFN